MRRHFVEAGQCPSCGAWNKLLESAGESPSRKRYQSSVRGSNAPQAVATLSEIEQAPNPVLHVQTNSERPNVLELERRLLTDDLALVPWLAMNGIGYGSHDGLPSS